MPNQPTHEQPLSIRAALFGVLAISVAAVALIAALSALAWIAGPADAKSGTASRGNEVGEGYVFPLPSKHTYGDGFGAGRGHDGQDLFAKCGRKLVAAHDGKVQMVQYDGSGYGNMLVLDSQGTDVDLLYAHMRKKAVVSEGEKVTAGEKVGEVGDTGNATGCHLHFEMHTAPGFWEGGHAMRKVADYLKKWDRYS